MGQHEGEWLGLLEAACVSQLHEEQQCRGGRLEARHDRVRCEFEEGPDFDQSEQGLEEAAQKHNREEDDQDQPDAVRLQHRRFGVNQSVEKRAQKKRAVDLRGVYRRCLVAKQYTDHCDNEGGVKTSLRAIGKIFVAQGNKGKHSEPHRQRNGDGSGYQAANNIVAEVRSPGMRHRRPSRPRIIALLWSAHSGDKNLNGTAGGSRTSDLLIHSQAL